jgi:hypothetical protein
MAGRKIALIAFVVLTFAALVATLSPQLKTHRVQAATEQRVNVLLNNTPDIPVEIANPIAVSLPGGLKDLTYSLVNRGSQRLLAVEVTWELRFENGVTTPVVDREDYAFGSDLAPGASDDMEVGSYVATIHPSPLQSVTGEITFAQFADSTTFGSDRAKVLPWLKEGRSATLNEYHRLLEIYRGGGESELEHALVAKSDTDTLRARADRKELQKLQSRDGIKAVEAKLSEITSLKLPQ